MQKEQKFLQVFHDKGFYHIGIIPLIFFCDSMDWFICDTDRRHEGVNQKIYIVIAALISKNVQENQN